MGIPDEKLDLIFESFAQADISVARKYGGTGLGLSISKHLVERMGGKLTVKSIENEGSIFSFSLPLEICEPSDVHGRKEKPLEEEKNKNPETSNTSEPEEVIKKIRILIAEDAEDNRILMELFFANSPFEIEFATNGQIAYEKVISRKWDLILMDMQMPIMNGYEATQAIRTWEEENQQIHLPIVALTADAVDGQKQKYLSVGCTAYLSKPVSKKQLLGIVSKLYLESIPSNLQIDPMVQEKLKTYLSS